MIGSSTIFSIIIGLIIIVLLGRIFYIMYDDMTIVHWIPQTIIAGVIVISLVACVGIVPVISMLIIGCTGNSVLGLSLFIPVLILGISLLVYALKLK